MKAANPRILNREIASVIGCSISTVQRYLNDQVAEAMRKREAERYAQNKDEINRKALARYYRVKAEKEQQCSPP